MKHQICQITVRDDALLPLGQKLMNQVVESLQKGESGSPYDVRDRPVSYTHLTLPTICSV
eukprot:7474866-Alexandrium_andersonii.AAC.1